MYKMDHFLNVSGFRVSNMEFFIIGFSILHTDICGKYPTWAPPGAKVMGTQNGGIQA